MPHRMETILPDAISCGYLGKLKITELALWQTDKIVLDKAPLDKSWTSPTVQILIQDSSVRMNCAPPDQVMADWVSMYQCI